MIMKQKIISLIEKVKAKKTTKIKTRSPEYLYIVCRHSASSISRLIQEEVEDEINKDKEETTNNLKTDDAISNISSNKKDGILTGVSHRVIEIDFFFQKTLHQIILDIYLNKKTLQLLPETNISAKNINTHGTALQNKMWLRKYEHKKFIKAPPNPIEPIPIIETVEAQICDYAFGQIIKSISPTETNLIKEIMLEHITPSKAQTITTNFLNDYKKILVIDNK